MKLIPWYYELAFCGLILAMIFGSVWGYGAHEYSKGEAAVEAKYQAKYEEDMAKARAENDAKVQLVEKAHADDLNRMAAQDAAAARAGSERGRLLAALANRTTGAPPPAPGPGLDGPTLIRAVVAACSGRYEEVAGAAGKLTNQVIGLQNYVRSVGLAPAQTGSGVPLAAGVGSPGAVIDVPIQPAAAPRQLNPQSSGATTAGHAQ